ncbi:MAG TPA: amino acid adenylation domain-containing protein, partial [Anaeromyxobacteraceae bacterium]|nr:amino acid adenylation domain-containing protein [Anaeromyxobacteraceae bacterium]
MTRLERLVSPWATRTPNHPAIEGDETLTYGELDALANRFARAFIANDIRPGDRIGIHLPRSGRGVAAMLGALRAGAVYVPLDPGSPPVRVQLIARDCGLRHVVISPPLLAGWLAQGVHEPVEHFFLSAEGPAPALPSIARAHQWSEIQGTDGSPVPSPGAGSDDLAYILYTSGSTGVPKGVMLSHRNALAFVDWAAEAIHLSQADRVASVAPFHFDLSVFDIWASLSRGSTVVIVDEATVISGQRMLDRIHAGRISTWYSVPSALLLMLENGCLAERGAPSLRTVFFAGEVFPVKHLVRAMGAIPNARFFNLFGPTETNVCTAYEVVSPPKPGESAIPIGRASCGDVLSILDAEGAPVGDGETGELHVDGPTVMLGYWNGGRRTAARRPYPTGDLVSRRLDGELMYHGRRDHQVKIHGFRIELGEVESALLCHPAVREAIAIASDQKLATVIVPSDGALSV